MSKPSLLLDYDGSIFDSPKAICKTYNLLFKNHIGFIPADHTKLKQYDMKDLCPLCDDVLTLFETKLFFEFLEPFENAIEIIKLLAETLDITIVSVGTPENIKLKIDSFHQWFGDLVKFVPIISYDRTCKMDKSPLDSNMKICLDDSLECLDSYHESNIKGRGVMATNFNIIYGREYDWNLEINNKNRYPRCKDWLEVYNYIILLLHGTNGLTRYIMNHNIIATFNNPVIIK